MKAVEEAGGPSAATLAAPAYAAPDAALVADTERLIAFSYLIGRDHAAVPLDLADDETGIPFEEAVSFMKARVPLTKAEWKALDEQVRFRAFTVAALSEPDAIERVRRMAIAAVEKGTPLSEFWTAASAEASAGLAGPSPVYWETVYRTNVQTAYNAGRAAEFMKSNPEYLEFVGIEDTRQTDICAERSGVVLPATHPFWDRNWPPLHFNCRSTVRALFREEADDLRAEDPEWKPTDDGKLSGISGASKGFGGNPIRMDSFWKMTPGMAARAEKYGIMEEIKAFAESLGIQDLKLAPTGAASTVTVPQAEPANAAQPGVVPEFKTVREAEKWIVDSNLSDAASFKGCDVRVVQEWTVRLKASLEEFPEARKKMQFFGTCQERNKVLQPIIERRINEDLLALGIPVRLAATVAAKEAKKLIRKYQAKASHIAQYLPLDGVRGISVNKKFASDFDFFLSARKQDVAHGWKPVGTDKVGATLDHEMGHLLDDVYGLSKSAELQSYYQGLNPADIGKELSGYGREGGIGEFVAEAWSEYVNAESPRTMATTVAKMILGRRTQP